MVLGLVGSDFIGSKKEAAGFGVLGWGNKVKNDVSFH